MKKCLILVCLCLVPFVVFASTTQNPIELASGNSVPVLDTEGNPLDPYERYRIVSTFWGAAGGDVYLGPSPNSSAPCDDGVFRYNSDRRPPGTPVIFIEAFTHIPKTGIFENRDMNIVFSIPTTETCVTYAIWKVGDFDVSSGARLLKTGGSLFPFQNSWFRIVKASSLGYNIFYCPGPYDCPSCTIDQCQAVGEVPQDGKRRLALVNGRPLGVNFQKIKLINHPK